MGCENRRGDLGGVIRSWLGGFFNVYSFIVDCRLPIPFDLILFFPTLTIYRTIISLDNPFRSTCTLQHDHDHDHDQVRSSHRSAALLGELRQAPSPPGVSVSMPRKAFHRYTSSSASVTSCPMSELLSLICRTKWSPLLWITNEPTCNRFSASLLRCLPLALAPSLYLCPNANDAY